MSARRWLWAGAVVALGAGLFIFLKHSGSQPQTGAIGAPSQQAVKEPSAAELRAAAAAKELAACQASRERVLKQPATLGTATLDAKRVELLLRTKLEPVIFVQPPEYDPNVPTSTKALRKTFQSTRYPSTLLEQLTKAFRIDPQNGRRTLLRDGYLYADDPEQAFALVQHVRAEHLFKDQEIWIQRGDQVLHAERTLTGKYRYLDGALKGKEVSLVLFDRIGTGAVPLALHRDLRSLKYRLHFDRAQLTHTTPTHVLADLTYGGLTVPSVLKSAGARLELECEAVPKGAGRDLELYRQRGSRKLRVVQALRHAMRQQIEEELPFDEPYREWGQQDGVLRYKWRDAYFAGKGRFDLNGDTYYVFDAEGHPKLPQVCVDFLTDTLERTSGTWWAPLGQPPQRIVGNLDFNTLENAVLRRALDFVEHARVKSDWFNVYDTTPEEQIPFWQRQKFANYLLRNVERFVPGDIVLIRGHTNFEKKWERPIMHYHSFFIYESDPVTAMPIAIVGNAGVPSLRVWNTEMRRTPKRSIWHRVRPQLYWLESIVPADQKTDQEPAPLALGRD